MVQKKSSPKIYNGQSLVEFSLFILVLILLVSGIVDFARAFYSWTALRDAVQEGALYGSLHPMNDAGIESRVKGVSSGPIDWSQVSVTSEVLPLGEIACASPGRQIKVTATYPFDFTMPFFAGQTITITASVHDNILLPPCP